MRLSDQLWAQLTRLAGASALVCGLICVAEASAGSEGAGATQLESPQSRQEHLLQRRLQKSKNLQPYRAEFFEKLLTRFDRGRFQAAGGSRYKGFYPQFATIARGSGLAGGVSYLRPQLWGDLDVSASAFYSVRGYRHFEIRLGLLPNRGKPAPPILSDTEALAQLEELSPGKYSKLRLFATGRRRYQTQNGYFGSGNDSRRSDETNFLLRDTLAEVTLEYQIGRHLLGRVETGFLQHSLGGGTRNDRPTTSELFDDSTAPGLDRPPRYWTWGGSFLLDYRDNPGVPHRGFVLHWGWTRFDEVAGSNRFNFQRHEVDARGFIPLGSRQRVLAFRCYLVNDRPASGNQVPFFVQGFLGGRQSLRGFDRFRFRGEKLVLFQTEYRWEPSRRFELALFADAGSVSGNGSSLSLSDLKTDFGIGFRVRTSRATVFRLEQAWSRETRKTIVSLSASF